MKLIIIDSFHPHIASHFSRQNFLSTRNCSSASRVRCQHALFCHDAVRLCHREGRPLRGPLSVLKMTHEWMWSSDGVVLTGESQKSEKNLSQWQLVHHKSCMNCPGRESGPPRWEVGDWRPELRNGLSYGTDWAMERPELRNCLSYGTDWATERPELWNGLSYGTAWATERTELWNGQINI
jgi:hypothetical protein